MMTSERSDSAQHPDRSHQDGREKLRNEILAACLEDSVLAAEVAAFLIDYLDMERLAAPGRPPPVVNPPLAPTVTARESPPAESISMPVATRLGNYDLLAEIARGGMGVVYKARQHQLNRTVALKMIRTGHLATAEDVKRFHTEAEAAAHLRHPNIVRVHEVGEVDGQHFFSMEFIEGRTLAKRLAEAPVPGRTAALYVRQIARAIHYAHLQGILHRDLKPSNILLDYNDEPHVTDFGLAKRLQSPDGPRVMAADPTRTGVVLGTPSYMAPEQAAGKVKELGPACDVYGLGAVLYELLTGRPPFRSDTPLDTLIQVLECEPVPPRLLNPKVNRDLETICLKCLEKDPNLRYASADALADDLQRYEGGEPILARSYNILARLTRALRKPSHQVADLHAWAVLLWLFSGIIVVGHSVRFVLIETAQPSWLVWLSRLGQVLLGAAALWFCSRRRPLLRSAAERPVWTIWLGYLLASLACGLVIRLLIAGAVLTAGTNAPVSWQEAILYPFAAVLSGLAFWVMGGSYGGRFYVFGLAFFALSLLMLWHLPWAPLEFGLFWAASLAAIGWRLRQLGAEAAAERF
jgi:tRNA A-37 threonylcarbamoyl transferase component Bud32